MLLIGNRGITCFAVLMLSLNVIAAPEAVQHWGDISKQALFLKHPSFEENFDRYEVLESAEEIPADTSVLIFFGTWCHDSRREVPRMLKILEVVGLPEDNIKMVALDFSKTDPGGLAVANGVEFTPTFIFFRQQEEIGRIIEKPATTLEEAMVELLSKR
jgi:thioredoxin 1